LLAFATALVGFASIYVAGFSRFGAGRYMIFGIFLLVIMKMIESAVTKPTRVNFDLWPLIYAPSAFGILAFILMLYVSDRPRKVAPPMSSTEDAT
jgi:lipopolysaccharide export system permease protein